MNTLHRFQKIQTRGMTLIEIMVVIALVAGIMTVAAISFGVVGRADVQGDALRFSSIIRYAFNTAATSNETLQMKIDFDNNEFTVEKLELSGGLSNEELHGGTTMNSMQFSSPSRRDRATKLADEDTKFGVVERIPLDGPLFTGDDTKLTDGVYFIGLMTSHHDEIQTEGIGTINFFSNGFVERSVIYFGDETAKNGEEGGIYYTVTVSPLTAQSSVLPGKMEIDSSFFEEEEDR